MFDPPPERPLSVGDLVGRAFRVYRRHIPFFFRTLLGPTIVAAIGSLGLQWSFTYGPTASSETIKSLAVTSIVFLVSLVALLLAKWTLTMRQLAFVRLSTGFAPDYQAAYAFVSKRRWMLLALFTLSIVSVLGVVLGWGIFMGLMAILPSTGSPGLLVSLVASIVSMICLLLVLTLIYIAGFIVLSVLSCEDLTLGAVIARGFRLTLNDFGRSCAFGSLLMVAIAAISCPLSLPVAALSFGDFFHSGLSSTAAADAYKMPVYLMVLSHTWQALVDMLFWPVIYMAYGLLYYDLRMRQEGLDILRSLQVLESKPA